MNKTTLIRGAQVVNEGRIFEASILIQGDRIQTIFEGPVPENITADHEVDATGKWLLPGLIDDQVHFREPGLTHKAEIHTESRAAVAGGITSYMEMPNTVPNTVTQERLEEKYQRAAEVSLANYSFFMGATNDNLEEVLKTDPERVCGVKVFMGSSTGNMLVDNREVLEGLFSKCKMLIATHCEDEETIRANTASFKEKFGEDVPIENHPLIRSEEACYRSSSLAVELARQHGARLHVLHISTAQELVLFDADIPLEEKKITAEACVHHLWFSDADYATKGTHIKWNPAVKTASDRDAIMQAVVEGRIDVLATDHAPHTLEEKSNSYFNAPSGGPLVQHALVALLEHHKNGKISLETLVERACHAPAKLFRIRERGYIREGYHADLVLVDPNAPWTVSKDNVLYKCGWSPFEGTTFQAQVLQTWVNGTAVYEGGTFNDAPHGQRLMFDPS